MVGRVPLVTVPAAPRFHKKDGKRDHQQESGIAKDNLRYGCQAVFHRFGERRSVQGTVAIVAGEVVEERLPITRQMDVQEQDEKGKEDTAKKSGHQLGGFDRSPFSERNEQQRNV